MQNRMLSHVYRGRLLLTLLSLTFALTACGESIGRAVAASEEPSSLPTAQLVPGDFVGVGDTVLLLQFDRGIWTFKVSHEGAGTFTIMLVAEGGRRQEVAMGTGTSTELSTLNVRKTGWYTLDITAAGTWNIRVEGCNCSDEGGIGD